MIQRHVIQEEVMRFYESTHNVKHETEVREGAIVCSSPRDFSKKFKPIAENYRTMYFRDEDEGLKDYVFLLGYQIEYKQAILNKSLINRYEDFCCFYPELVILNDMPVVYLNVFSWAADLSDNEEGLYRATIIYDLLDGSYDTAMRMMIDPDNKIDGIYSYNDRLHDYVLDKKSDKYDIKLNVLMAWIYMNRSLCRFDMYKNQIMIPETNKDVVYLDTTVYSSVSEMKNICDYLLSQYDQNCSRTFKFAIKNKEYAEIIKELIIEYRLIEDRRMRLYIKFYNGVYILTIRRLEKFDNDIPSMVFKVGRFIFTNYNFNYNDPIFEILVDGVYYRINRTVLKHVFDLKKLYSFNFKIITTVKNRKCILNEVKRAEYGPGGEFYVTFGENDNRNRFISRYGLEKVLLALDTNESVSFKRNYIDPANMMKK